MHAAADAQMIIFQTQDGEWLVPIHDAFRFTDDDPDTTPVRIIWKDGTESPSSSTRRDGRLIAIHASPMRTGPLIVSRTK